MEDFGGHIAVLRRHWRLILTLTVCALIAATAALLALPKTYTATAQVLVTPTGAPAPSANAVTPRQRESLNLDTEAQIAASEVVATRAELPRANVEVTVPPNSAVLTIAFSAATADEAVRGAQAFADAYLQHRRDAAQDLLSDQAEAVEAEIGALQKRLERAVRTVKGAARGSAPRIIATQQYALLKRQIARLAEQGDQLTTTAVTPGSVISAPVPPHAPSEPSPPLFLGSALLIGVLGGLLVANAKHAKHVKQARNTKQANQADSTNTQGAKPGRQPQSPSPGPDDVPTQQLRAVSR